MLKRFVCFAGIIGFVIAVALAFRADAAWDRAPYEGGGCGGISAESDPIAATGGVTRAGLTIAGNTTSTWTAATQTLTIYGDGGGAEADTLATVAGRGNNAGTNALWGIESVGYGPDAAYAGYWLDTHNGRFMYGADTNVNFELRHLLQSAWSMAFDATSGNHLLRRSYADTRYVQSCTLAGVVVHTVAAAAAAGTQTVTCVLSPTGACHQVIIAATNSATVVSIDFTAATGITYRIDGTLSISNGNSRTVSYADTWYTASNAVYSTTYTPTLGTLGECGVWNVNGLWFRTDAVTNLPAALFNW